MAKEELPQGMVESVARWWRWLLQEHNPDADPELLESFEGMLVARLQGSEAIHLFVEYAPCVELQDSLTAASAPKACTFPFHVGMRATREILMLHVGQVAPVVVVWCTKRIVVLTTFSEFVEDKFPMFDVDLAFTYGDTSDEYRLQRRAFQEGGVRYILAMSDHPVGRVSALVECARQAAEAELDRQFPDR